ncbi:unnamed protein product [Plutella xylostella]|uniref:(diamondback moth) hypothetical protein n=1 Tax=Plutella xylostella TaxID=51655 RepID=A0A8S4CVC2_PLUXY|nr:unnamed protein product [Plutella xylostella]
MYDTERSIEVWLHSGRRHSEVLAEQRGEEGRLRHPGATLVLWLQCEQSVHDSRLDARVDAMLRGGLLQELEAFHRRHNLRRLQEGHYLVVRRLDAMLRGGLLQELEAFHRRHNLRQLQTGQCLIGERSCLWIANVSVVIRRLDARVDAMLRGGLLRELEAFHRRHNLRRLQEGQ